MCVVHLSRSRARGEVLHGNNCTTRPKHEHPRHYTRTAHTRGGEGGGGGKERCPKLHDTTIHHHGLRTSLYTRGGEGGGRGRREEAEEEEEEEEEEATKQSH